MLMVSYPDSPFLACCTVFYVTLPAYHRVLRALVIQGPGSRLLHWSVGLLWFSAWFDFFRCCPCKEKWFTARHAGVILDSSHSAIHPQHLSPTILWNHPRHFLSLSPCHQLLYRLSFWAAFLRSPGRLRLVWREQCAAVLWWWGTWRWRLMQTWANFLKSL